MPTPEDRAFFEGLNKDLSKNINKAIEKGFKGASVHLDPDTVKLIGTEFERNLKPLVEDAKKDDGGGGGGEGSAGEGKAWQKAVDLAKGTFNAARMLVSQNATNILAYGDNMARNAATTNQAFLMNGEKLSRQFGRFGMNLADMGNIFDDAIRSNVRGLGKNTQDFLARTTGLGTALGTTTKFLASNTNVLGRSMTETTALGTDLQNIALSNGMVADAMFDAVAAFEANTRQQQVLFGDKAAGDFQGIVAGLEGLMPGGNLGDLVAKAAPTSVDELLNLDILGGMFGGAFNSQGIKEDPARHTANFIAAMAKASEQISGMSVRQGAQFIEQRFGKFGITLQDIQSAGVATRKAGGVQGLMDAMKGGGIPIKSDEALQDEITRNSLEAMNNMKNFAIEVEGLNTVQKGLKEVSDILKGSFYTLNGKTTELAKTMGLAAAGEAGLQAGDKMGLGGFGALGLGMAGGAAQWALGKTPNAARAVGRNLKPSSWSLGGAAAKANQANLPNASWQRGSQFTVKGHQGMQTAKGLANPLTKAGRATMSARHAAGMTQGVAKGMSKKIPILGAALAGGFELAETGDKSRAAAVTAGAGLGGWGGAAAGAAIGTMIFPGVGTVIGGLIGGIGGALGGEKAARTIHDEFDTDFVKEQEEKAAEAAHQEEEAKKQEEVGKREEDVQAMATQQELGESQLGALQDMLARLDVTNGLLTHVAYSDKLSRTPGGSAINGDAGATQRG